MKTLITITKSTYEWIPYDKILNDGIIVTNEKYIKILKIIPINYDLKSELEKEAIINSYKTFLKICNFDFQILIQSKKENLDSYISNINDQIKIQKKEKISKIANDYISYIKEEILNNDLSFKNFYITISCLKDNKNETDIRKIRETINEKIEIVKENLSKSGNSIYEINSKSEILDVLFSFYNYRKSIKFI